MAWTSPTTASAGTVLTAATWNAQVRSNMQALLPLDALAWTSYTPTLTQSSAVTKTVTYAKYTRFGNCVIVSVELAVTGTGTAANTVTVSLPVTATRSSGYIGVGGIFDASAAVNYGGLATLASTTTVSFVASSTDTTTRLGNTTFTAAIALADGIAMHVSYEV